MLSGPDDDGAASSAKARLLRPVEVQDGGPLPLALGVPDDLAAEQAGDRLRREIAMEVEVASIEALVARAEAERQMRRVVFGGEDEPDGVAGEGCGALDLRQGEVVNGDDGDGAAHVSELGL